MRPGYQAYKDLSDYEKELEDVALVASPTTNHQEVPYQGTISGDHKP